MKEQWKIIEGCPDYEVSNYGRVKSFKRTEPRILKTNLGKRGYTSVNLCAGCDSCTTSVHRLVAKMFIGSCPEGLQVNHKDGDKINNRVDNLEYVTPSENVQHSYDVLGHKIPYGVNHYRSKLNDRWVKIIRKMYATGRYTYRELDEIFGVSITVIRLVIKRKTWKHVK